MELEKLLVNGKITGLYQGNMSHQTLQTTEMNFQNTVPLYSTFVRLQEYEKVGILLVEVYYKRVGESVI